MESQQYRIQNSLLGELLQPRECSAFLSEVSTAKPVSRGVADCLVA